MTRGAVLKGSGRQRAQERLLLRKAAGPASLPLLEGLAVECFQAFMDRFIQLRQRQKLAVPQSRQNEGGDDADSITSPVHLHDLTWLVIQVHGGVGLGQIVGIILVELGGLIRDLARREALVAVFQPQQVQRDTAALELLMDVSVVRHHVNGLRSTDQEQTLRELLVRHFFRQRPFQTAVLRPLKRSCHGIPGALAAGCNLRRNTQLGHW